MTSDSSVSEHVDPRAPRPTLADERTTLVSLLHWHRLTFELKCSGLGPQELARRGVAGSALSLLGLIRHHAEGERFWFREVLAGQNPAPLHSPPTDPDAAFEVTGADPHTVVAAWDMWRAEVAFAEEFVEAAADLEVVGHEPGEGPVSLRWVLLHMIEEYARHSGHADLLREQIDGVVGL